MYWLNRVGERLRLFQRLIRKHWVFHFRSSGVEKRGLKNHDIIRTTRLAFYGGAIFAPILVSLQHILVRHHRYLS